MSQEQPKPGRLPAALAYESVMDRYKQPAGSIPLGPYELANHCRPFEMKRQDWPEHFYSQLCGC